MLNYLTYLSLEEFDDEDETFDLSWEICWFNLSFSCLRRAITCYWPDPDPDEPCLLSESFSISIILALKSSISLSLYLKVLWILFQSFPDPTKSPIIFIGYSNLTANPELTQFLISPSCLERFDDPERIFLP